MELSLFLYWLQVHPIFMLSIADCLLATLWVAGGIIYLGRMSQHKTACLFVSLFTVVRGQSNDNYVFVWACTTILLLYYIYMTACLCMWYPCDGVLQPCSLYCQQRKTLMFSLLCINTNNMGTSLATKTYKADSS